METTSNEELDISKEITPKEYQVDHTDYTDVVGIAQQDRTMGLVDRQPIFADFLEFADSQVSR